jgi:hypothetical protein
MEPSAATKERTLAWLRTVSGELSTATIKRLEETLPWYGDMPPGRRSAVGLVAQAGITSFISWFDDPRSTPWIAADVFGAAPRELLRSISLQQTLQLIRVTVEVVEERVKDGDDSLREAILLYSREIAFASADVYARAAEARGLWDARLEALVVDSILRGEYDDELPSRIAALGWHGHGEVSVLVGTAPRMLDVDQLRRTARHLDADVLIGVQGSRLVLVIGRAEQETDENGVSTSQPPFTDIASALEPGFGDGHLVLGHEVPSLVEAAQSAKAVVAERAPSGARRRPAPRARPRRRPPRPIDPRQPHLQAAEDALDRAAHDPVVLPRQRAVARGHGTRAVRAPQHGPLPPQARLRRDRLGRHRLAGGHRAAVGAHPRVDRRHRRPGAAATLIADRLWPSTVSQAIFGRVAPHGRGRSLA